MTPGPNRPNALPTAGAAGTTARTPQESGNDFCQHARTAVHRSAYSSWNEGVAIDQNGSRAHAIPRLVLRDLVHPPLVAAAFEVGRQPDLHHAIDQLLSQKVCGHTEDVGIVVPAAHLGLDRVAAGYRANAGNLVGHDAHAEASPADEDAAIGGPVRDRFGDREGVVRVVAGAVARLDAKVADVVRQFLERRQQALLDLVAPVITPDGDSHGRPISVISRST